MGGGSCRDTVANAPAAAEVIFCRQCVRCVGHDPVARGQLHQRLLRHRTGKVDMEHVRAKDGNCIPYEVQRPGVHPLQGGVGGLGPIRVLGNQMPVRMLDEV